LVASALAIAASASGAIIAYPFASGCTPSDDNPGSVCARENHHRSRVQMDHILLESHKHLRSGLAADAAVDVGLAGKEVACPVRPSPAIRDGIAHKHNPPLARRRGR